MDTILLEPRGIIIDVDTSGLVIIEYFESFVVCLNWQFNSSRYLYCSFVTSYTRESAPKHTWLKPTVCHMSKDLYLTARVTRDCKLASDHKVNYNIYHWIITYDDEKNCLLSSGNCFYYYWLMSVIDNKYPCCYTLPRGDEVFQSCFIHIVSFQFLAWIFMAAAYFVSVQNIRSWKLRFITRMLKL